MKPMGLTDPRTGRRPWAVVQLRQEDARAGSYNLVGFQNHMRFGEQQRVLRMIPGMENAEFLRFGQVHRNTYINGPALLHPPLQLRQQPSIFFAGQISGVEGYVESIATGLIAGRARGVALARENADARIRERPPWGRSAPMSRARMRRTINPRISRSIFFRSSKIRRAIRKLRHTEVCRRALAALGGTLDEQGCALV